MNVEERKREWGLVNRDGVWFNGEGGGCREREREGVRIKGGNNDAYIYMGDRSL